jgi:hypothetical protein
MRACILLIVLAASAGIAGATPAMVMINEIFYDSTISSDGGTFTELLGDPGTALDGYTLVGVNGNDGLDYATLSLNGMVIPADGRLVIAKDNTVPNYDYISTTVDWQNGPDEVELRLGADVIDGICYGYAALLNCEGGTNGPDVAAGNSISRCPDGQDTNDNLEDTAETLPTPGALNGCPTPPVELELCEALAMDQTGQPIHLGQLVHITSPLTVLSDDDNFSLSNLDIYATDGACCVNVFATGMDPVLSVGDWIDVTGTVTLYFGKFEISSPGCVVTFLSGGHPIPDPEEITTEELALHEKDYEGCLVSICGLRSTGTGDSWPISGSNANYVVQDATAVPITLRVDKETDIDGTPAPVEPFTAIGVVGYYSGGTTPPAQIMPRQRADVLDGVDCAHEAVCCVGEDCYLVFQADCEAMGGVYHTDWLSCGPPNPCARPHVCCGGEICYLILEEECASMGGTFHPEWDSCTPNPCARPHVCCVGEDCLLVLEAECAALGGAFHPEWNSCTPNPCALPHVCCIGETCQLILATECAELGGVFHPEWDSCTPNPCELPHVCCVGEDCYVILSGECAELGGIFHPEWGSCTPNPCELPHVCCVGEDCYVILSGECAELGGAFHPEWDSCGPPNPCQVSPAAPDTWGAVKSLYR